MSDLRKAAQQALEALENGKRVRACEGGTKFQIPLEDNAITALRAALAQEQPEPAQEPVAGAVLNADGRPALVDNGTEDWHCKRRNARRLYTAPQPQRPPLTDEEIDRLWRDPQQGYWDYRKFARAIERKVRGKE